MPGYTNVPKPTSSIYSKINPIGKQVFDDSGTTYDDASTPYDGILTTAYTNVSKPISSVYTKISKPT